jgi:hypothetical protein
LVDKKFLKSNFLEATTLGSLKKYLYFFESHFSIIQTNLTRKNTIKIFDDVFICLQKPVNLLVKFAHGSADQKIPQSHQIT